MPVTGIGWKRLVAGLAISIAFPLFLSLGAASSANSQPSTLQEPEGKFVLPEVSDSRLAIQQVVDGLSLPTSMTFLDDNNILVTQKGGKVVNVSFTPSQSLELENSITIVTKFNVSSESERGLLGIATMSADGRSRGTIANLQANASSSDVLSSNSTSNATRDIFVFLYLTESEEGGNPLGNRVYRYQWNSTNESLYNKTLILDLPAKPGPNHNGGKIITDSSAHLYVVIGDLNRDGALQNYKNNTASSPPDDTSVILKINTDGSPAKDNPFVDNSTAPAYANLSKYYAYGIRNSFGMALDPLTGILWDTENGPGGYDEINIVRPGFNSGWEKVMGPIERRNLTENELFSLPNATYADPVFSWRQPVGVTEIEFFTSKKLGDDYENNIFVGDFNNGNLYFFKVNETRTGLKFDHPGLYDDLVASNDGQVQAVTFGKRFGSGITDIETGPDGNLYVLTYSGTIYRIVLK